MGLYDRKHIQNFYDEYGDLETSRWNKSIVEQVKLAVHKHHLYAHVNKGDSILELGAGTGIFTKELASLSSDLIVTDLSPVQLDLNLRNAASGNYADKIKSFHLVDICDLSQFNDNSFDKVVCYGGPLSYVFEKKHEALSEIHRVLKPGGLVLLSVMCLWGTAHQYLTKIMLEVPPAENEKVMETGNLHPTSFTPSDHHCHMFRSEELKEDLRNAAFELVELSASNCLSAMRADELEELEKDKEKWNYFMDMEIRACKSPGMIESGTHLIAVARKS